MKGILIGLALVLLGACATEDPDTAYASVREKTTVGARPDGSRSSSTAKTIDINYANTYSFGEGLAVWVQVDKTEGAPAKVMFRGSRGRSVPHAELSHPEPTGAWDRPDPAYVGYPWQEADFKYTDRETTCPAADSWCWRMQQFVIELTADQVRSFIAGDKSGGIPIALFPERKVDWRVRKVELLAALDALGVTGEFR